MDEPEIIQWLDSKNEDIVKGKRVLIVDEVDDTRLTLQYESIYKVYILMYV
jgi:hypoxanthine phosphoribosyltransferase